MSSLPQTLVLQVVSPDAKGPISSCVTISFEVFLADNSITSIDEKLPVVFFFFSFMKYSDQRYCAINVYKLDNC